MFDLPTKTPNDLPKKRQRLGEAAKRQSVGDRIKGELQGTGDKTIRIQDIGLFTEKPSKQPKKDYPQHLREDEHSVPDLPGSAFYKEFHSNISIVLGRLRNGQGHD
jgi:hypothetical protein